MRSTRLALGATALAIAALLLLAACSPDEGGPIESLITTTSPETTETAETTGTTSGSRPGGLSPAAERAVTALEDTFQPSAGEEQCLLEAVIDNPQIFDAADDPFADPTVMADALDITLDCLDDETVAAAFAEGLLAEAPDLTAQQVTCLTDGFLGAPDAVLADLIDVGADPLSQPSPETVLVTVKILGACDLGSFFARDLGLPLTDEQAACFADGLFRLDDAQLLELFELGSDPTASPSPGLTGALIDLLSGCDIDPNALGA